MPKVKMGGKRHRAVRHPSRGVEGISSAAFRRMAHRAGAVSVSPSAFAVGRTALDTLLRNIAHDALVHVQYCRRRTITPGDVRRSVECRGYKIYGA